MQSSQRPRRLIRAFANAAGSGFRRTVPDGAQTGGAASYDQGFPPETFQPVASGGIPPSGQDMNGVLFDTSGAAVWAAAGGMAQYSANFANAIGGYPRFAQLAGTTPGVIWQSSVENNLTDPDSAGAANWIRVTPTAGPAAGASSIASNNGFDTLPSGLILCWGQITVGGNGASQFISLPTPHASFCHPGGSPARANANVGFSNPSTSGFTITNNDQLATIVYWNTRGL